ncbi:MAG: hypothetical protein MJ231_00995 [bacterium]|nr:hypothetical protein [bacterium]
MAQVNSVETVNSNANYNAVKIKIDKPKTLLPNDFKSAADDKGVYNAVSVEVTDPIVARYPNNAIYDYPKADKIVTYDMIAAPEISDKVSVPAPNFTTVENEKSQKVSFNGKQELEVVPAEEIKPDVDINKVLANLSGSDYDKQAKQLEEITVNVLKNPNVGKNYIVKDVFAGMINIIKADTTQLMPPTEAQIEARKKIITNEIIKEQAKAENKEVPELPYKITEEDIKLASELSTMEMAERNKEYALYTMAILTKLYVDEVKNQTGNVIPITDLPGVSETVDVLRFNQNPSLKIAALDALSYIYRPEYKDELKEIFKIAAQDDVPYVAEAANMILTSIDKK